MRKIWTNSIYPKKSGFCKFSAIVSIFPGLYEWRVLIMVRLGCRVNSPGVRHRRKGGEDDGCGQTGAVLLSTER